MYPRLSYILVCLYLAGCDSPENGSRNTGYARELAEFQTGELTRGVEARTDQAKGDGGDFALAWFSSEGRPAVELPVESQQAFAFRDLYLIEGLTEWRGFEVDLDHDGGNEIIVRDIRKEKIPQHWIIRKFEGEWEWIGSFYGEFSLFKQTGGWMDDIVVLTPMAKSDGKKSTTMKFNGLCYREVLQVEEEGNIREMSRLFPDPLVPPQGGDAGWESPLIGTWVNMTYMASDGPASITTVSINQDGAYHLVEVDMVPGEESRKDGAPYKPVGAELKRHETGRIDLRTGREVLPPGRRSVTMRSIHWEVIDGKLHWNMDMGTMGGQGVTYSPVD